MGDYARWADIRDEHVERAGGEEAMAEGKQEYALTVQEVLAITGGTELLSSQPELNRTLNVRDTYLEPLHHLQVALLRQYRELGETGRQTWHNKRAPLLSGTGLVC